MDLNRKAELEEKKKNKERAIKAEKQKLIEEQKIQKINEREQ